MPEESAFRRTATSPGMPALFALVFATARIVMRRASFFRRLRLNRDLSPLTRPMLYSLFTPCKSPLACVQI